MFYLVFGEVKSRDPQREIIREIVNPMLEDACQNDFNQSQRDWQFFWFLMYMAFASVFMAMNLTNWSAADIGGNHDKQNSSNVWIKIIAEWITVIFYVVSLFSPHFWKKKNDMYIPLST